MESRSHRHGEELAGLDQSQNVEVLQNQAEKVEFPMVVVGSDQTCDLI